MDVEVAPDASRLRTETEADTVITGSGIAGLSTAYELSGQGQRVIVLDRGKIGSGMTARTTAHLSANNDDTFKTFIDKRRKARQGLLRQPSRLDHAHRVDPVFRTHRL
jgi:glycine/D-amino acid oxidase-like deaminating enzyme